MASSEHGLLTERAVRLLPDWQKALFSRHQQALIRDYCLLPDRYWDMTGDGHAQAAPYAFATDDITFHYLPDTPVAPLYRYWRPDPEARCMLPLDSAYDNPNWRHARDGFVHYLGRAIDAWKAESIQEATACLGWLLHVLQDYGFGIHSLEGPYGTDAFFLHRVLPDARTPDMEVDAILGNPVPPPSPAKMRDYIPRCLGLGPGEIALHLYKRYVDTTLRARTHCFEIVTNARRGEAGANGPLWEDMYRTIIYLCADVMFTVIGNATGRLQIGMDGLRKVSLTDLEPVQRPVLTSKPYWAKGMLINQAVDPGQRRVPLQLLFEGSTRATAFNRGFALGGHDHCSIAFEVPAGVYAAFDGAVGLHTHYHRLVTAHLRLTVGDETVVDGTFDARHSGERFHVENPSGPIVFTIETTPGLAADNAQVIWADPMLTRLPF